MGDFAYWREASDRVKHWLSNFRENYGINQSVATFA